MTGLIDAYCTLPHYAEHCRAVLDALPEERRGHIFAPNTCARDVADDIVTIDSRPPENGAPLLTAGYQDTRGTRRPVVLLSHGAGQRYVGAEENPSYDGGPGRERVGLFLCPNEQSAQHNRDSYPDATAVAVGCPKLDRYLRIPAPRNDPPVVAVSFHWPCTVVPEAGWAFPTWRATIEELAASGVKILGHAHPRARRQLTPWYAEQRIETVWSCEELLARADVLVIDNSSFAYEWAACDQPVVFLDDASWRPDVHHGLRFGEPLPGPRLPASMAKVAELRDAINRSPRWFVLARAEVTQRIYGTPVSGAAQRAANAILKWEAALHA